MADVEVRTVENEEEWETFMAGHPEANFLHSWQRGEYHLRMGHTPIRTGLYVSGRLKGVSLAIYIDARRGRHLAIPGGPIMDWGDDALVEAWITEVRRLAAQYRCAFVRCRPQLPRTEDSRQLIKRLGFKRAPLHLHAELTSQLDITRDNDTLKRAMRKGTRYELNRTNKLGIKVTATDSPSVIDKFYDLQIETAKRQSFVPFSRNFLTKQFEAFAETDNVLMYEASHEGQLLAMAFIIFYGQEAAYHYGASTELARKLPGAYAIQWEAIQEARRRGCSRYNFWGVAEHGQTNHRFAGVSVFKRGFGGEDVAYLQAHDLITGPAHYAVTYALEKTQHKLRRL